MFLFVIGGIRYRLFGLWVASWLALVSTSCTPTSVYGEVFYRESRADIKLEYNDNRRLTLEPHDSVWGTILSGGVNVGIVGRNVALTLSPLLKFSDYSGGENITFSDQYLNSALKLNTEKSLWSVLADYSHDTTVVSEFEDSGLTQFDRRRNSYGLSASWVRDLSERLNIRASVGLNDVSYENGVNIGLFDYRAKTLSADTNFIATRKQKIGVGVFASSFNVADIDYISDAYGAQLSLTSVWTERFETQFSSRRRYNRIVVDSLTGGVEESGRGWLFDVEMSAKFQRGKIRGNVSRDIDPSGLGTEVQRDKLRLSFIHRISSSVVGSLGVEATHQEDVQENSINADRDYGRFLGDVHWQIADIWFLKMGYIFNIQHTENSSDSARSNSLFIQLQYAGRKNHFES